MNPVQNQTNTAEQQEAAPRVRPCPQDCARCNPWQQIYCVTRMTYDMSIAIGEMREQIARDEQAIAELKTLLTPASEQFIEPSAQQASGA